MATGGFVRDEACTLCGGTGFVYVEDPEGRSVARPCACRRRASQLRRERAAGIPDRYRHCTFETFSIVGHQPSLERAFQHARRVVDDFPGGKRGLLLAGACGVGKTHLAVSVLRELVESRGARGVFQEAGQLIRALQDSYDRSSETSGRAILEPVLEADVLLLDDVGVSRPTPFTIDTLGLILNERYNAERMTLVTTNLPPERAEGRECLGDRVGDRVASRLCEMCFSVVMEGRDFRRYGKNAGFNS